MYFTVCLIAFIKYFKNVIENLSYFSGLSTVAYRKVAYKKNMYSHVF